VTIRRSLPVLVLGLLAAGLMLLALTPAAGAAKKPCWQELIDDWYDGRIDKSYPVRCYREAQKHIPEDARVYSSLPDDLDRALQSALSGSGGPPDGDTLVEPVPGTGRELGGGGPGTGEEALVGGETDKSSPILGKLRPSNADSIPIPLLVLAGLAMLLFAAAATSFLARRIHGRRATVTTTPRPPERRP
jgi:hypothetical protein